MQGGLTQIRGRGNLKARSDLVTGINCIAEEMKSFGWFNFSKSAITKKL